MARGGYTFNEIREMNSLEVLYLYHYQELSLKEQQGFLTNTLGVVWDKSIFTEQVTTSTDSKPVNEIFIPLSLAINPNVMEFVKAQFGMGPSGKGGKTPMIAGGEYSPKANEVISSMAELSKEDFLKMMGKGSR
jgi:hypothetical protein